GLLGEFDAPGFADDGDADLAGVLEIVFNFAGDGAGQRVGLVVADGAGLDHDAEFAASLEGVAFFHTSETHADALQLFDALEIRHHGFGAGAGTGGADGVSRADEGAEGAVGRDFAVVGGDGVDDFLGFA